MKYEEDYKHKILFFFMPEKITFFTKKKNDDENAELLKSISPYFYWCSAHEFHSTNLKNKFLFQYQIYTVENRQIIPDEVVQRWYDNKNSLKLSMIDFIDMWEDHKRVIFNPKMATQSKENTKLSDTENEFLNYKNNSYEYFSTFASFTAKSIMSLRHLYIKQAEDINFDFLQKKFWQSMAIYYQDIILNFEKQKKTKKKRKIKNETVHNKRRK